jgi:N-acetylglucosamine-6-phosphate deacetylase
MNRIVVSTSTNNSLLLRGGRFVLPERVLEDGAIEIAAGRIAHVFENLENLPAIESLDLSGLTVFPGFIDLHIHGAAGIDAMTAGADGLLRMSEHLARQGTTSLVPTLVPASAVEYEQAIRAIEDSIRLQKKDADKQSRILGVHYEGPFVNSEQCGALHREHFRTFTSEEGLNSLPKIANETAIHVMTVAPEVEGGIDLVSELHRRGWVISLGHTRAAPDVLDRARAAGARHMTHFMNAMSPLHHRAPGPIGWGLLNEDVTIDLIADGVHIDPLMLKVLLRCVTAARMTLISDAIAAAGQGDGDYEIWGETISVKDDRTRNAHGNIAGSVIGMIDAVRMMLSLGASECDAARMASTNPARLLGIDRDCGSIEAGKRADLVALDGKRCVQLTFLAGKQASEVES